MLLKNAEFTWAIYIPAIFFYPPFMNYLSSACYQPQTNSPTSIKYAPLSTRMPSLVQPKRRSS